MTRVGSVEHHARVTRPRQTKARLKIFSVETLPAVKTSVQGPRARSNHYDGYAERCQEYASPRVARVREGEEDVSQLNECHNNSGNGRPQTGEHED